MLRTIFRGCGALALFSALLVAALLVVVALVTDIESSTVTSTLKQGDVEKTYLTEKGAGNP